MVKFEKNIFSIDAQYRFWLKVRKGKEEDDCWLWIAGKSSGGYGCFHPTKKTNMAAHVYSFLLSRRVLRVDEFVLHTCDVPACVNPKHLFSGTQKDNRTDCINKKRHIFGEQIQTAKLTELDVIQIIQRLYRGDTQKEIGSDYNISPPVIGNIWLNRSWKHIPRPLLKG